MFLRPPAFFLRGFTLRLRNSPVAAVLLVGGFVLCAFNFWVALRRSAIPRSFDNVAIVDKETRREKHPGHDDVHLLRLEDGRMIHVDRPVFEAVRTSERLSKTAWTSVLQHDGRATALEWSADARGMAVMMPLMLAVLLASCIVAIRAAIKC